MKRTTLLLALAAAPLAAAFAQPATTPVEFRDVDEVYAADGVVEAVRQSTVAAQIAGRIVELRADVGDRVAKGQVLARIDEREAAQVVASSEAQIARATADLANARATLDRNRKLLEKQYISQAAVDRAQAEHDAAAAALAAAKAGTGAATAARSHTVITAPFAGVIAERPVQLGEMAQPGRPLFAMFDPGDLRVLASVPEDVIARVRTGAKGASAELPALARTVPAKSVTVLPSADARTHSKLVRLDLPDGDGDEGRLPGHVRTRAVRDRERTQAPDPAARGRLPQRGRRRVRRHARGRDPVPAAAPRREDRRRRDRGVRGPERGRARRARSGRRAVGDEAGGAQVAGRPRIRRRRRT